MDFLKTPILSGVFLIGAIETQSGTIFRDDRDPLITGAFTNDNIPLNTSIPAKRFLELCSASGKVGCKYDKDVGLLLLVHLDRQVYAWLLRRSPMGRIRSS